MNGVAWVRAFLKEVLTSTIAQRVPSLVTLLLVLGATATVLVTAGRNAGAEAAVLARIDEVGTRTLTVYGQGDAPGFTSDLVADLARYDVIESVTGFGPVQDVTATANPDGTRVGMRTVYGSLGQQQMKTLQPMLGTSQVLATTTAADALGLLSGRGAISQIGGRELLVTGTIGLPAHLSDLEPLIVQPREPSTREQLASIAIVADTPQDLPLVTQVVTDQLVDVPRDKLRLESSQQLAELRRVIGGELTIQSRAIVLGVLGAAAAAALVVVWSIALMRRKDFGRRRALGATRAMILALILAQTLVVSTVSAVLGAVTGVAWLIAGGHPVPTVSYIAAVLIALVLTTTVASALPAGWAARRDPLTELRVP